MHTRALVGGCQADTIGVGVPVACDVAVVCDAVPVACGTVPVACDTSQQGHGMTTVESETDQNGHMQQGRCMVSGEQAPVCTVPRTRASETSVAHSQPVC